MRRNFGVKTYLYPQPVLIIGSYDENGVPDLMNAAWGGISEADEISMCLSEEHQTVRNILGRKAFTVSVGTADQAAACDYVGMVSGGDVPDKVARAGFHTTRSPLVDAPLVDELPLALECTLVSYDPESCRMVGRIVNVCAEERILDGQGNIDPAKLQPIAFDPANSAYHVLGAKVADAFSAGAALMNRAD